MPLELPLSQSLHYSSAQTPAHLSCCTSQLRQTIHHISYSIYMTYICSFQFLRSCYYLFVGMSLYSYFIQIKFICGCSSSDCENDCIELLSVYVVGLLMLYADIELPCWQFLYFDWQGSLYDVYLSLPQVSHDEVDHISIKGPQIVPSSHEVSIVSHSVKKSSYLYSYITSADNKSLSRCIFLHEDIITCYRMLSPLNTHIRWPCARCNNKVLRLYLEKVLIILIAGKLSGCYELIYYFRILRAYYGIFVFKGGQAVKVVHVHAFVYSGHIAEVDGFYVALNLVSQFCPIEVLLYFLLLATVID